MNKAMVSFILTILSCSIFLFSCSHQTAPTAPGETSTSERFSAAFKDSWTLFTDSGIDYNEVGLATLVYGPNPPTGHSSGEPVALTINSESRHLVIAVTVKHDTANDVDQIYFSWLDDTDCPEGKAPLTSPALYYSGGSSYYLEGARVAAWYEYSLQGAANCIIRVAVVCAATDRVTSNKDIMVIHRTWTLPNFPSGSANQPTPVPFADPGGYSPDYSGAPDWHPDIAVDPVSGRLHVVWSAWTNHGYNRARLAYRRGQRLGNSWAWTNEYLMDEPEDPPNSYTTQKWVPRIAVGNAGFASPTYIVGVAYTEWDEETETHIHVGCVWWPENSSNPPTDATNNYLHLHYNSNYDAGLPRVTITPQFCGTHYGALTFTQDLGSGNYEAVEINNLRNGYRVFQPVFNDIEYDYGVFPAVACHLIASGDPSESVSYFYWDNNSLYHVISARFNPNNDPPTSGWTPMTGDGVDVNGTLGYDDYQYYLQIEPLQPCEIVTIDGGTWHNAYWVAWCDYINEDATKVYAAFGDTT